MSFASIGKFEQVNDVRVNLFQYHKGGFHSPKNLSAHLLATHGLLVMRTASSVLATTITVADAALGDVHAVNEDEINGNSLRKSESAFFDVLETYVIGGNQPMDKI